MNVDAPANPLGSSADSTLYDVLTQSELFSLITSFQHGLPGATAPLVIRYLTTATGRFTISLDFAGALHKWWKPSTGRILTPLGQFLYSKQIWRERVTAEAVAKYDTEDLDALRFQLAKCASERRPDKARRRCVHNAWESAAAFGRVDMLAWLAENHGSVMESLPMLDRFAAQRALKYGHTSVLTWLHDVRGMSIADDPVLARSAVARALQYGNVALGVPFFTRLLSVKPIAQQKQNKYHLLWDTIVWLVDNNCAFPITLLDDAIKRQDFEVVQCLLNHLPNALTDYSFPTTSITHHLLKTHDVRVLELLETADVGAVRHKLDPSILLWSRYPCLSEAAVRSLVRLSPTGDVAMLLMQYVMRHELDRVETVLTLAEGAVPPPVVAFVQRVMHQTLGPVASLAHVCVVRNNDGHLMKTIVYRIPRADRDDVRDTVLQLLLKREYPSPDIRSVLNADASRTDGASCDEDFLQLCLSLRHSAFDNIAHGPIANYLRLRKWRKTQETAQSV